MRTELQRQASRLNGAKSRGPRTAAGKQRSSQNACRHGLYSPRIPHETLPAAPAPLLVTVAQAAFHYAHFEYMHVAALEAHILSEEIKRQRILHPDTPDKTLSAIAFLHLCDETGVMAALYRLQSAASRRLERAFECLQIDSLQQNAAETEFCGTNPTASSAPAPTTRNPSRAPAEQTSFRGTNLTARVMRRANRALVRRGTPPRPLNSGWQPAAISYIVFCHKGDLP